jgi:transposase InsO family protein
VISSRVKLAFPACCVLGVRCRFYINIGPARVRSAGGKLYVLVVVDDYSRYAWVFFLEDKGETFGFVRDLVLRLRNKRHGDAIRAIRSDNGSEFRNSRFETFCHDLGLEH